MSLAVPAPTQATGLPGGSDSADTPGSVGGPESLDGPDSLGGKVRRAVLWRSGSQVLAQSVQWAATFLVIRILDPHDYGLFAMTQVVLVMLNMLNGGGLASALIREEQVSEREIRQLFGMLVLLNGSLALAQIVFAPLAAAYYRQPIVADMLRVQAVLYLFTPFIALSYALLSRGMEFRHQATANIAAAVAGAIAALGGALAGWGVWTLVFAPIALFGVRAAVMTWATGSLVWPLFDFRGAGRLARFGGMIAVGQFFWFLQSQADVFIAGRSFSPHVLGIYTTSLFLTQIFVSKFVPALNDVAFAAYSRIQGDADALASVFVRATQVIMVVAMPLYLGLAVTAEPLVAAVLGAKWAETAPIVRLLALSMPFMTLQVLLAPACDARGRPDAGLRNGMVGAGLLIAGFLVGVHWGPNGLAWAWLAAYPLYLAASAWRSLPIIGARASTLAAALAPSVLASVAMAMAVMVVDHNLPALAPLLRLAVLVSAGGIVYASWLALFARSLLAEVLTTMLGRRLKSTRSAADRAQNLLARVKPARQRRTMSLDDPDHAAFAWARFRRLLGWTTLAGVAVALAALAALIAVEGPLHWVTVAALFFGVVGSVAMASALMGLVFLSSGTGHDEDVSRFD